MKLDRKIFRIGFVAVAVMAVALALTLTAARVLFPLVEDYRSEVESWAGGILGQPVTIGSLDARWRGLYPEVILEDVHLLGQQDQSQLNRLERIILELDIFDLLLHQRIGFVHLSIVLDRLTVQRTAEGALHLLEFRPPAGSGAKAGENEFAHWLLRQGNLGIAINVLYWQELASDESYSFRDISFELRNDGDLHQLEGNFALPAVMGKSLRLAAEVKGNPLVAADWDGKLYLTGKDIALGHWLQGRDIKGISIPEGRLDFELWSEWAGLALMRLEGDVRLGGVKLLDFTNRQSRAVNVLQAWLDWRRLPDGWQLSVNDMQFDYGSHVWPRTSTTLRYVDTPQDALPALAFASGYLHMGDIVDLLSFAPLLDESNQGVLGQLRPRGEIRDLQVVLDGLGGYSLKAALDKVGMEPWERVPGFSGASGHLHMSDAGGSVSFDVHDATFDWPRMFRAPLLLDRVTGRVDWVRGEDEWLAYSDLMHAANQDIRLDTRFEVRLPLAGGSAHVDINAIFGDGNGAQVSRYLPVGVMSDKVVAWLDQGIQGGHIPAGTMVYHGRTRDFPFRQGEGRFEVAFGIESAAIVPNPGWPRIEDIRGEVRFAGSAMDIDVAQARVYESRVGPTRVTIEDMKVKPALLAVDGAVTGDIAEYQRYISESPLRDTLSFLDMLTLEGRGDLKLQMQIPLAAGLPPGVSVNLRLPDNRLVIKPVDLEITHVKTDLLITESRIESRRISADLYGHAVSGQVVTRAEKGERDTVLDVSGTLDGPALSRYFRHPFFSSRFSGRANWDTRLHIPYRSKTRKTAYPVLTVTTDLAGLGVDLAPPLGKKPDDTRKLVVDCEFPPQDVPLVRWNFGQDVSGVLAVAPKGDLRGELRMGGGAARLPTLAGISVAGVMPEFSVSEWTAMLEKAPADAGARAGDSRILGSVSNLNLQLGSFEILGQNFSDVRLMATRMADVWVADIGSREMSGRLQIPLDPRNELLSMSLEHWTLARMPDAGQADGQGNAGFVMARLPPMKIDSKRFHYADMDLGSLVLVSRKEPDAYFLDTLELSPPAASIHVQGLWKGKEAGQQRTDMDVKVTTRDAGKTMGALGFAGTVKNGDGQLAMTVSWPGTPFDFEPGRLSGNFLVDIKKGRLLELDPGAGRIFGLLSLQALPRRMSLDFSDMFSKGFSFDRIGGGYDIRDGVASTTNLVMESPSARIDIDGRVDLGQRSYDQHVLVTPHVAENLPLLGVLAASPQVGAVILLAQRIFRKELEKITQFEYTITGPWDAPVVEKVIKETKINEPTITE